MRRTIFGILKNLAALSILLLVVLFVAGVGQGIRRVVDGFGSEDREDTTLSANAVTYSVMLSLNKTNAEDAVVSPDWMVPHAYGAFTKLGLVNSNLLDSAISDTLNTVSNSLLTKVDVEAFNVYTNTAEIDRIVLTNALQVETSNRILGDLSLGDLITVTSNSLFVALWQEVLDREIADLGLGSQIDSVSNWVDNAVVDIWENFSMLDYRFSSSTNDLWEAFASEVEIRLFGDSILSNSIVDVQSDMYSISNEFSNAMTQEREHRILGDSLGSNHVHSVESALSNRLDSVESALTGTSNGLASAISAALNAVSNSLMLKVDVDIFNAYTNIAEIDRVSLTNALQVETSNRVLGDLSLSDAIMFSSNRLSVVLGQETLDREIADLRLDGRIDSVSNWVDNVAVDIGERFSLLDYGFSSSTNDLWDAFASEIEARLFGDSILSNSIVDVQSDLYSISNELSNAVIQERVQRISGDFEASNHVHSVESALSNRLDSVESALTGTSNELASAISAETDSRIAGDAANHIEIVGVQAYSESVSNKFDLAVHTLEANLPTKVSTNHVGDVTITGDVSATSFIGDGSQLSGVSGGVEFPELLIYSSGATTTIPFTKDYKYYMVVATNTTDIVFDYSGIGDFAGSVLEFQLRVLLVSPRTTAVAIPAEGDGLKYVGDVDIRATVDNTVQHLGMLMYSTNNVLMSHWYYEEP